MRYPEKRFEFTVNEVSKACGISRATLLRMEECGFLTPYRIDPNSGYRYYDADNITQIGQYLLFMEFGLSRREATDMYYHWGSKDTEGLLDRQKLRISRLQRLLNELEMRYERTNDFTFSYVELPETTCCCIKVERSKIAELETIAYSSFQNVVKEGFRVQVTESMFLLMPESEQDQLTLCIPVSTSESSDPRIRIFQACRAFSIYSHGDYTVIPTLLEYSHAIVSSRKLKAAGPVRLIYLVAPYVGEHISNKDYCYECVLPIEEEKS